jgi:hypothetical protein
MIKLRFSARLARIVSQMRENLGHLHFRFLSLQIVILILMFVRSKHVFVCVEECHPAQLRTGRFGMAWTCARSQVHVVQTSRLNSALIVQYRRAKLVVIKCMFRAAEADTKSLYTKSILSCIDRAHPF